MQNAGYIIRPLYETLILKSADFLVAHRDPDTRLPVPSYDLWEERYGGGLARYQNDRYQREDDVPESVPGNPWFISMLWLGEYLIARAGNFEELHEALPCLEWCAKNALPSGVLAEQVHPVKGYPLSVSPLTWSHAAYVWVVLQYVEKFDSVRNDAADAPPPRS